MRFKTRKINISKIDSYVWSSSVVEERNSLNYKMIRILKSWTEKMITEEVCPLESAHISSCVDSS